MKNILLIFFLLLGNLLYAQYTIQLLDKETEKPIAYVHFLYQDQKGSSSLDGKFTIKIQEKAILKISHVNYGKTQIDSQELERALATGILYLNKTFVSLMPATVIARKRNKNTSEIMAVENSDKLSHDAGEFLAQSAMIGGIRKSGSYGFDPVLRGFKYDQISIIMDNGLSATAACPNRMDPPVSQIPMNMVDRVEILKGPYSLRFGNSFGGSIHFKSKPTVFSPSPKAFGRLSGSYESNGNIFRNEALTGTTGKFYSLGIYGAYSKGSDYKDGDGNFIKSEFNRRNIGWNSVLKLSQSQHLKISANNNFAENVDFPALNMDLKEDNTWLISMEHKINFSRSQIASITTSANASFVDHEMDNLRKELNPRMVNATTKAKTKNFALRSEAAFQFTNSTLYTGVDFKSEQAKGTRSRELLMGPKAGNTLLDNVWQDSKISKTSIFGEYHFSLEDLYFVSSARFEYNEAKSRDTASEFINANSSAASNRLNTSLSLGSTYDLSKQIRIGLWLGRAERSGSLTERFINFLPVDVDPYERIGNTDLHPEINYQADLNLTWKSPKSELLISLFSSYINDYISSVIREDLTPRMATAPGVKQYINIDKAIMRGFEINFNQKLTNNFFHRINMAYTFGKNKEINQALPEIPPLDLRYTIGALLMKAKLQIEILFRHTLKQNRIAKDYGETVSPGFSLFDFKASYAISDHVQCKAGIRNIFDKTYYEHLSRSVKGSDNLSIYAPGRTFYATFAFSF
ncbi:TonB-dependent receptor domain-containing protein [Ancylomarina longa]|uniref:TonB-dependent receptor n=1 Tax=Ancylomarina longa TaxID=2487017 RepID=A0A434AFF6_9BACT|nr:TonB-dependent receptor [Ancylomarina longa]RUT73113.1 TonB-dependent receptor [Ancylomarina longa]